MVKTIRIGSRESKLAVIQSELVMAEVRRYNPEILLELVTMKTTGDKILDRSLDEVGGKGLFIKELDEALLDGRVDACVHSYKDMPAWENPALPVVAVSKREDGRDVLILPHNQSVLDKNKPIGCSSLRRRVQLTKIFPDIETKSVRGNVPTRLKRLDDGEYSALVLAAAGIKRLGLSGRVHSFFEPENMLPAACQGILAVQMRIGEDTSFLKGFHDDEAWDCSVAERAFIRELDGGCSSPVAAYATINRDIITLNGMYVSETGRICKGYVSGARMNAENLGAKLAMELRDKI